MYAFIGPNPSGDPGIPQLANINTHSTPIKVILRTPKDATRRWPTFNDVHSREKAHWKGRKPGVESSHNLNSNHNLEMAYSSVVGSPFERHKA